MTRISLTSRLACRRKRSNIESNDIKDGAKDVVAFYLKVGQCWLDPLPNLPNDRLRRLMFPWPLAGQELVPNCAERINIAGPAKRSLCV